MDSICGVIFDLDQTLLDRDQSLKHFLKRQWQRHEGLQNIPQPDFQTKFLELDSNGKVWKDAVYQRLIDQFSVRGISASKLLEEYVLTFADNAVLFPGVNEVLQELKGQRKMIGMITNGRTQLQSSVIKASGLEPYFDAVLISESEGVKKPEPEIFQSCLSRLGLPASSCVFIGDDPQSDILGAHKAGMKTVWKRSAFFAGAGEVNADAAFDHFEDLPAILASL